jgi:hypothetical protein
MVSCSNYMPKTNIMKPILSIAIAASLQIPAIAFAQSAPGIKGALSDERIGLLDAATLKLTDGKCTDCASSPQSLWYFQNDVIAAPTSAGLVAGVSPKLDRRADVKAWAQTPAAAQLAYPTVTWIGAPQIMDGATIDASGTHVTAADGTTVDFALVPKISTNLSYANKSTTAYLQQRKVRLRGTLQTKDGKSTFVARTLWPADYAIDMQRLAAMPLKQRSELTAYVQDPSSQKDGAVSSRLIWERTPGAGKTAAGKPVLGIMLNGAQNDDDESLAGHFGVATGYMGQQGEWADWAMNNIYSLGTVSEKGIIAATVPMDNYLTDLNSGQQFYRPSYMLVAVLKNARTAVAYQGGIQRTLNHFYRQDFTYGQSAANCAGVSIDVLRDLGWSIPMEGPTSRVKAVAAYAYIGATERSLAAGRAIYDNLNEEKTRMLPALAFEAAGWDLLQLVGTMPGPTRLLSPYEQQLKDDVDAIILVKIPQIPSSRVMGSSPVFSFDEYIKRTPSDRADWKIVPVAPRPFPVALRDGDTPAPSAPAPVPLPVAGVGALGVIGASAFWRRLRRKKA